MFDEKKGVEKVNIQRSWIVFILLFVFLVAGCTGTGGEGDIDQAEEKKIKEKAIQYIKDTYNKDFEVSEVSKDRFTGQNYTVRGNIKDEKNTQVSVIMEQGEIRDTYVGTLWTEELKPKMTTLAQKHFDVRELEHIVFSNGRKRDKYTGDIPSVFHVLENGGDPDYTLDLTLRVYEQNGQYEQGVRSFLQEIEKLGFNKVIIEIYVSDDKLKSIAEETKESEYTLYRYNIVIDDIQKVDIDSLDLDRYKTVIKH